MNKSFDSLKNRVINNGLCTSCGACKGVCPNDAINYDDRENNCIPILVGDCISCGMCDNVCVGAGFNVQDLKARQYEISGNKLKDEDNSYFLVHATNPLIWKNGASGGFVTATLLYALNKKIIKHAVVITNDDKKPWLPKVVLAHSENEIISAMQSKYCVVPTLEILSVVRKIKEPVALVMLPCQAQAYMNIRKIYPNILSNVVITIGLMCGNSLPFRATQDVLKQIGVDNLSNIIDLKYRDGLWHGDLHVRMNDGTEKGIPYTEYMRYMGDFYRKSRCKLCIDGDAMFSDLSSGDGWIPNKKQDNVYGWSVVHTHTAVGEKLLDAMQQEGCVYTQPLSQNEALGMKHMYKRYFSSIPRIEYKRRLGENVPTYIGLDYPRLLLTNKILLKKRLIDKGQAILFSPFMRKILSPIPLKYKSYFLEVLLKFWYREK